MSTDPVVLACPACGSSGISAPSNGVIYCVDCNRIYPAYESDTGTAEHGRLAAEMVQKVA